MPFTAVLLSGSLEAVADSALPSDELKPGAMLCPTLPFLGQQASPALALPDAPLFAGETRLARVWLLFLAPTRATFAPTRATFAPPLPSPTSALATSPPSPPLPSPSHCPPTSLPSHICLPSTSLPARAPASAHPDEPAQGRVGGQRRHDAHVGHVHVRGHARRPRRVQPSARREAVQAVRARGHEYCHCVSSNPGGLWVCAVVRQGQPRAQLSAARVPLSC
eukprot:18362-Prymnesium_polylepis.2